MKRTCEIVICGDLCPTSDTEAFFASGDAKSLFRNVCVLFEKADIVIGNLEFPLTDIGETVTKCGPVLKGKKDCVKALQVAGFDALGLANNHIRDCGDEGVLSTLECCRRAGIATVGAGANASDARKPIVIEKKGWKIGIMAFAEHEFNAASKSKSGANLFDVFDSFDQIREVHESCDYLIVLYHGGVEHYPYPSPILQKKCRKMVECGAQLVLCQHSHCVGSSERYCHGTIVYGQGNTLFGYRINDRDWNNGLLVKILLSEVALTEPVVEYIPIAADRAGIDLLPPEKSKRLIQEFLDRSKQVGDETFIHTSWDNFCKARQSLYLPMLLGLGRVANFANRKLHNKIIDFLYSKTRLRATLNLVRCEAHHEVVQTILQRCSDYD